MVYGATANPINISQLRQHGLVIETRLGNPMHSPVIQLHLFISYLTSIPLVSLFSSPVLTFAMQRYEPTSNPYDAQQPYVPPGQPNPYAQRDGR